MAPLVIVARARRLRPPSLASGKATPSLERGPDVLRPAQRHCTSNTDIREPSAFRMKIVSRLTVAVNPTLATKAPGQVSVSLNVVLPPVTVYVKLRRVAMPVVASVAIDCTVPWETTSVSLSTFDSHAPKK